MATLVELRNEKLKKLNDLKALGIDPFPAKAGRNTKTKQIYRNLDEYMDKEVIMSGMIKSIRSHSKLVFMDLKDFYGEIQLYIKEQNVAQADYKNSELNFSDLHLLDPGDFVDAQGKIVKTKTGTISVEVTKLRILTKSLRPLPNQWDGLKDIETRFRRRYLDTKVNEDVKQRFIRKTKFWQAHRELFREKGFYEINIPVLEHIPGGGDANPFTTHMDALDQDFYLRISQELPLKRLIGGGYEKVFEIGPRFRNEGLSDEHLPEHMAMEFYWAYADWKDGMKFVQELFKRIIHHVYDDRHMFSIRGFEVDFSKDWEIIDFGSIFKEKFNIDAYDPNLEDIKDALSKNNVKIDFDLNIPRGVDNLWKLIRKDITGPAFLINHPKYLSPLQKASRTNPNMVERFQPIIAGSELGNGWSEVTDPIDQFERFSEQQAMRDAGDKEAQWLDIDYVEMLEYGMPPTFGYGHSERVFWFLEDVTAREGVIFPQLKHEISETTKEIYGISETKNDSKEDYIETNKEVKLEMTKQEAQKLLEENVKDEYQKLHALMVATAMETYATKYNENPLLWYITGLLHDVDYELHPEQHPNISVDWYKKWNLPEELIHAVLAHAHDRTGVEPKTTMAKALCAIDELSGFLYAYSLMRPEKFEGMQAGSVKKKFKDKAFARKISREDVTYGLEQLGVDFTSHIEFLISIFDQMPELK